MDAHPERYRSSRAAWLRAAVLGAGDGLVSTAALLVGVAASGAARNAILVAGIAALTTGVMAMATGEYFSVSAQSDTESADRRRRERELAMDPDAELDLEVLSAFHASCTITSGSTTISGTADYATTTFAACDGRMYNEPATYAASVAAPGGTTTDHGSTSVNIVYGSFDQSFTSTGGGGGGSTTCTAARGLPSSHPD